MESHLVMKVGTRSLSAHPDLSNLIPPFHFLPGLHQDLMEVAVAGCHPEPMGDDDEFPVNPIISNIGDKTIGRSHHNRSSPVGDIDPFMHLCQSSKGVCSESKI